MSHGPSAVPPLPPNDHGGFDKSDINLRLSVGSLIGIVVSVGVVFALVLFIDRVVFKSGPAEGVRNRFEGFRAIPQRAPLEVIPGKGMEELRAREKAALSTYSRQPDGTLRIAIERAMELVLPRLPVVANAPQGDVLPGGEDRSRASMPSAHVTSGPSAQWSPVPENRKDTTQTAGQGGGRP